jgi:hypothetical protein
MRPLKQNTHTHTHKLQTIHKNESIKEVLETRLKTRGGHEAAGNDYRLSVTAATYL